MPKKIKSPSPRYKICHECNTQKSIDDFDPNRNTCKECISILQRKTNTGKTKKSFTCVDCGIHRNKTEFDGNRCLPCKEKHDKAYFANRRLRIKTGEIHPKGIAKSKKGEKSIDYTKGRVCNECNQYKDREYFNEVPNGTNGLVSKCKECVSLTKKPTKHYYHERKAANQCVKCGSNDLITNIHCLDCWYKDRAAMRGGGVCTLPLLKALWEQQRGRCFYTGIPLVPGINASLDHQIPRSKGGTNDISNLKWVDLKINVLKSTMTHKEFIKFCKLIAKRFK